MPNLSTRSTQKELLDNPDISFNDIKTNLKELNTINTLLGGHAITLAGVAHFVLKNKPNQPLHICEMGCGGGDNINAIAQWAKKHRYPVKLTGIDLKAECITYAKERYPQNSYEWICADYNDVAFTNSNKPDIIFSSLFCHHFTEDALQQVVAWMQQNSKQGFFINDLQRSTFAYHSIKWLTRIFSKSYLVKNDAPLSVARGFRKKELDALMQKAEMNNYTIHWKWAFRWLVIFEHAK